MPTLDQHTSANVVKLLNIGESKVGKTGGLASLAKAGYRLHVLDYDNGLDILRSMLRGDEESLKRVQYEIIRDTVVMQAGLPRIKPPPRAYKRAGEVLTAWHAEEFTSNDVLILDTLTAFSECAFNHGLFLAGRLNQRSQLQDYQWMGDSVKLFIEMITSPELACHVIVNTHLKYLSGDEESQTSTRGLPNAKGQEISKVISRYFNTVVLTRSTGQGSATRRLITTQPQGVVEVATSNPVGVKATYPLSDGMAALFKDILGHGPTAAEPPSATKLSVVEN